MNRENFQSLLTDLFGIYNPNKASDIPNILDKYNGQEFDAIKTIYFKYNFRAHPKFDAKAGSDAHVKLLISKYSDGERVLLKDGVPTEVNVENITLDKKVEEANFKIDNVTQQTVASLKGSVEEYFKLKADEMESYFKSKNEELNKRYYEFDEYIKKGLEQINVPLSEIKSKEASAVLREDKIELKVNLNFEDTDLVLPTEVNSMPAGSRFIVLNSKNAICALEIKDV